MPQQERVFAIQDGSVGLLQYIQQRRCRPIEQKWGVDEEKSIHNKEGLKTRGVYLNIRPHVTEMGGRRGEIYPQQRRVEDKGCVPQYQTTCNRNGGQTRRNLSTTKKG